MGTAGLETPARPQHAQRIGPEPRSKGCSSGGWWRWTLVAVGMLLWTPTTTVPVVAFRGGAALRPTGWAPAAAAPSDGEDAPKSQGVEIDMGLEIDMSDGAEPAPPAPGLQEGEFDVRLARPLGISIKKAVDSRRVFVTSVKGHAEAAGVRVGDELVGVASVFGDAVWALPATGNVIAGVKDHIKLCEADTVPLRFMKGEGALPSNAGLEGDGEGDFDEEERTQARVSRRVASALDKVNVDFSVASVDTTAATDTDERQAQSDRSRDDFKKQVETMHPEFHDPELLEDEYGERRQ